MGPDSVSTDDEVLLLHGYSAWSTINSERLPIAVVYPRSTQEVAEVVKVCAQYRVPMSNFPSLIAGVWIDMCHSTVFRRDLAGGELFGAIWRHEYRLFDDGQNYPVQ